MSIQDIKRMPNILPYDGEVYYYGLMMSLEASQYYLKIFLDQIQWKNDEARIFGKHFITKRKVAWYGDQGYQYTYSKTTKQALAWTPELLTLRDQVQDLTQSAYNSCLLNLYHTGSEGMAWHSDDEKALGKGAAIASVSFGAERRFLFRHRHTKETIEIVLAPGSLLVMQGETQSHWVHRLPVTKKVTEARVNLTFRMMVQEAIE
ncbi:MAG: alpha-ketoglutarate-dependent dioxygenase AlkB [Saprospiraceae bacterium]|nr:alpha-ketoglutarate-dependent dioxygenase AlkB [Saprospiraceae bacterium]